MSKTGLRRFVAARFSPEDAFGLHLTIGVALMLCAAWLFGRIAYDVVSHAEITAFDVWLSKWFHTHKHSPWTPFMLVITHAHSTIGLLLLASAFALYLRARQASYWLLTLIAAVPGGMLLNVLLKYTFQRARPSFAEPILLLDTYSFPSGHALGATVLYGVLAAYLVSVLRSWPRRVLVALGAALMITLVALSRVYLGVHYLSDVVAGAVEGVAWLAICITAISTLRRRRALQGAAP